MHRQRLPFLCALAASLACSAGCAPSGDDPNSRLSVYEPPGGEYRVRYLEPPWELVQGEGTTALLRIRSNAMVHGGLDGGLGKYELAITVEPGDPVMRVHAEEAAAESRGETIVAGPRAVSAQGGSVEGMELLTEGTEGIYERHFRYVYFPLAGGRVVRMAFDATPALDTSEVDAMIEATGIGAEGS